MANRKCGASLLIHVYIGFEEGVKVRNDCFLHSKRL